MEGCFIFQWGGGGGGCFQMRGGFIFKWGSTPGGHQFWWKRRFSKKSVRWAGTPPPLWENLLRVATHRQGFELTTCDL